MPDGAYLHDDGTVEEFQCAAGPAGWRYVGSLPGSRVDVTVDSRWRQIRLEVLAGAWMLRGGVSGADTVWLRGAARDLSEAQEHSAWATGFAGRSPGLLVATARSLQLAVGGSVRLRLVEITEPVLAVRLTDQEWVLAGVTEHPAGDGVLPVHRYRIADLGTGLTTELHLCGDIVLTGPGVELHRLSGPPTGS